MDFDLSFDRVAKRGFFACFFSFLLLTTVFNQAKASSSETSDRLSPSPFSALQDIFGQDWSAPNLNPNSFDPHQVVSLIDYLRSAISSASRVPAYDRSTDFGTWIYPDAGVCKNTRALVLLRDADPAVAIHYTNANECSVLTGLWHDSYTAQLVRKARDLDIDHVVPLHNAWMSGAYRWDSYRRCHYTNYIQNTIHLRAVSSAQNRAKGDKSPADFMPEDRKAACAYLSDWMKIKMIWELSATSDEVTAIESLFRQNHCDAAFATLPVNELLNQRAFSQAPQRACIESHLQPDYGSDGV